MKEDERKVFIADILEKTDSIILKIKEEKEKIYWEALNHFNVNFEDIPERCARGLVEGMQSKEIIFVDGKRAITIETAQLGTTGAFALGIIRHYLGESE